MAAMQTRPMKGHLKLLSVKFHIRSQSLVQLFACFFKFLSLDEVFVISRIIEVEVGVLSRSRRLRLITLTIVRPQLFWISQQPNLIIVLLYIERKKLKSFFCVFANAKQYKAHELDMITLRNHAPRSYMT